MRRFPLGQLWPALLAGVVPAASLAAAICPADLDGDGVVGSADQELLVTSTGPVEDDDPARSRADLNGNGWVCEADLAMMLDNWGPCPSCPADLNQDARVDAADRLELEAAFGRPCRGNLGRGHAVGEYDLSILQISLSPPGGGAPHPDADPRADLNGDGIVDAADEGLLIAELGTDCRPDLSSDGHVDIRDLWSLLAAWGPCPEEAPNGGPTDDPQGGDPPKQCDPKGGL